MRVSVSTGERKALITPHGLIHLTCGVIRTYLRYILGFLCNVGTRVRTLEAYILYCQDLIGGKDYVSLVAKLLVYSKIGPRPCGLQ